MQCLVGLRFDTRQHEIFLRLRGLWAVCYVGRVPRPGAPRAVDDATRIAANDFNTGTRGQPNNPGAPNSHTIQH